jgi:hypothetical protein
LEAEIEDAAVKALVEDGRGVGVVDVGVTAQSSADAYADESANHGTIDLDRLDSTYAALLQSCSIQLSNPPQTS